MRKIKKDEIADFIHGTTISCPDCTDRTIVYHFKWTAIVCGYCGEEADKDKWKIVEYGRKSTI